MWSCKLLGNLFVSTIIFIDLIPERVQPSSGVDCKSDLADSGGRETLLYAVVLPLPLLTDKSSTAMAFQRIYYPKIRTLWNIIWRKKIPIIIPTAEHGQFHLKRISPNVQNQLPFLFYTNICIQVWPDIAIQRRRNINNGKFPMLLSANVTKLLQ